MATTLELYLLRHPTVKRSTFGELYAGGVWLMHTLEDVIREVSGRPVAEWKVWGETAIPAGRYRVTLETSPKFGPDTITLHDVPGFVGVRVHSGNRHGETAGCPLVGLAKVVDPDSKDGGYLLDSRRAEEQLTGKIKAELDAGHRVYLTIENPKAAA